MISTESPKTQRVFYWGSRNASVILEDPLLFTPSTKTDANLAESKTAGASASPKCAAHTLGPPNLGSFMRGCKKTASPAVVKRQLPLGNHSTDPEESAPPRVCLGL